MFKLAAIHVLFALAGLLLSQQAEAAVVEVDVTIKSVDAKARGITVTYETKTGQKSIDLDVSRKATITINGSDATLDALRPGQKAKVAFEKELQVVTKIDATGNGAAPGREVYRITLQLSEFGDGKFRIEKTSQAPADDFEGTPFKFSRWPKTKATKGKDGLFRLVHDFSDADDLDVLALQKHNATLEKDSGVAVFTPGPIPKDSNRRGAWFNYNKKIHLPMTVVCDVVKFGGGRFGFHVTHNNLGMLNCLIMSGEQSLDSPFDVQVAWTEAGEGGKQTATTLFQVKGVTLEDPFEKRFRLPLPNAKVTVAAALDVIQGDGNGPTTVARLEVRGQVAPILGIDWDEKAGVVFAKTVFPNGLAAKAGFQIGDVILAINGKKPQTRIEAVDMFSRLPISEEAIFTVQRADKTQELRVVAE
jgi:hypothetical protein